MTERQVHPGRPMYRTTPEVTTFRRSCRVRGRFDAVDEFVAVASTNDLAAR